MKYLVLGFLGAVLLKCWLDQRLNLLLHSNFHSLVLIAGLVLLMIAIAGFCSAKVSNKATKIWPLIVLSLTAMGLWIWPPKPSLSTLAANRSGAQLGQSELSFLSPPEQRSLTDWVRLLNSQPDPNLYGGDPVQVSGFVLDVPGKPPEIARLLVRCCLADATPAGLAVRWPKTKSSNGWPKPDQWLQIKGVMAVENHQGSLRSVLVAKQIKAIAAPTRPLEP